MSQPLIPCNRKERLKSTIFIIKGYFCDGKEVFYLIRIVEKTLTLYFPCMLYV